MYHHTSSLFPTLLSQFTTSFHVLCHFLYSLSFTYENDDDVSTSKKACVRSQIDMALGRFQNMVTPANYQLFIIHFHKKQLFKLVHKLTNINSYLFTSQLLKLESLIHSN